MATMTNKTTDVVRFLKEQHEQVKGLFAQVLTAHGKDRERYFFDLRRLLAVHETAEEEIVHPAAKKAVPNGAAVVAARLAEEKAAKKVLAELETMNIDSPEFEAKLRTFQGSVLAHAEAEETQEFAHLSRELEHERLERMGKAVELAEAIAPTRPHAGIESQAANLLAGPFASMLDRARDAVSGKR